MLSQLIISNVAVIEKSEITLFGGFNVLTGETGAGKSLIIDSLNMVLGERSSRDIIRHGEKRAKVEAMFLLSDAEKSALEEEIGPFEGNEIPISREIFDDGRNVCKVNGEMSSVAGLKKIGHLLVNIHGQNDGQKLLSKANHIDFVDHYALSGNLLAEYKEIYSKIKETEKEIESLKCDESEKLRKLDSLRFWLSEIDSADLIEGEEEELSEKLKIIKNSEKIKMSVIGAYEALYGGDINACACLSGAVNTLSDAASCDGEMAKKIDELSEILYRAEDVAREISSYGSNLDFDEGELSQIEERLYLISKLKTKYGSSISEILSYADTLREEVKNIEFSGEREAELSKELTALREKLSLCADKLSSKRKAAAEKIEKGVNEELKFLDMEKVRFGVLVEKDNFASNGQDKIEFMVSTNPQENLKPLVNIASGGEMSRICLAIKTVLSDADGVGTLVFDEIDTGVSGKAAGRIGEKLCSLGKKKQVICITHLPQIASLAENHYLIEKSFENESFSTNVHILDHHERVLEVARIISGDNISESAKKAAEEMIKFYK